MIAAIPRSWLANIIFELPLKAASFSKIELIAAQVTAPVVYVSSFTRMESEISDTTGRIFRLLHSNHNPPKAAYFTTIEEFLAAFLAPGTRQRSIRRGFGCLYRGAFMS